MNDFYVECDFIQPFDCIKSILIKTDIRFSSFTPFNIVEMVRKQSQYFFIGVLMQWTDAKLMNMKTIKSLEWIHVHNENINLKSDFF